MNNKLKKWIDMELGRVSGDKTDAKIRASLTKHNPSEISRRRKQIAYNHIGSFGWINEKLIRIYTDSSIPANQRDSYMSSVESGIGYVLDELELDFKIELIGVDNIVDNYIKDAMQENLLNPSEVAKQAKFEVYRDSTKGGIPHADVILSNKNLNTYLWGWCTDLSGCMVIGYSHSPNTLRKIAKHETTHLLGNRHHHGDSRFFEDAKECGYEYVKECVGNPSCKYEKICPQCFDSIVAGFLNAEKSKGIKFFK
ncbi:hypothetical protein GF361_02610 [Candidatus Woesearchaeota archaeon]|nr:hypothetical protein [Candidatus Woesearchaeota archaeon]